MSTKQQSEAVTAVGPGGEGGRKMVKLSVEGRSGTARFRVGVQAKSIRKALSMVGGSYPGSEVRVLFPIEPEGFVAELAALAGVVVPEITHQQAA